MPADFQASVAVSDPMVPFESPESRNRTSLTVTSAVIPVGVLDVVPRGGHRDVGVVARDVLPQKRWVHAVGDGDAVPHDALGDVDEDVVGAVSRVEFGSRQSACHERDDDDRDQDDRLPVEESPAALLLDCGCSTGGSGAGWLGLRGAGPRGVVAGSGRGGPPAGGVVAAAEAAGTSRSAPRRGADTASGSARSGVPAGAAGAAAVASRDRVAGSSRLADQAGRGVAAAWSSARFCLIERDT